MSLKHKIIAVYVAFAFLLAFYSSNFGPFQGRSFAYNLGRGVVWPVTAFPTLGTIMAVIMIVLFVGAIGFWASRDEAQD